MNLSSFFTFAAGSGGDDVSEKVRITMHFRNMTYAYNIGSEKTVGETMSSILEKQRRLRVQVADMSKDDVAAFHERAFHYLHHVCNIMGMTKLCRGITTARNTDKILRKHIHIITGTDSRQVLEDVRSGIAVKFGNEKLRLAFYEEYPEERDLDVIATKEKMLECLIHLLTFEQISDEGDDGVLFIREEWYSELKCFDFVCDYRRCVSRQGLQQPTAEKSTRKLVCGRCKIPTYCSKECQRADWKTGGHKDRCFSKVEEDAKMEMYKETLEALLRLEL